MKREDKPNEMVFCLDHYDDEKEMWDDVGQFIRILTTNGYVCTARADEPGLGVYALDYDYADEEMGSPMPFWLTPEQMDRLDSLEEGDDDATD